MDILSIKINEKKDFICFCTPYHLNVIIFYIIKSYLWDKNIMNSALSPYRLIFQSFNRREFYKCKTLFYYKWLKKFVYVNVNKYFISSNPQTVDFTVKLCEPAPRLASTCYNTWRPVVAHTYNTWSQTHTRVNTLCTYLVKYFKYIEF